MVTSSKRQGYWYLERRVPKAVAHLYMRVKARKCAALLYLDEVQTNTGCTQRGYDGRMR